MLNERLSVSAAREWFKVARALLKPDWLAMVDGYAVRSLLAYQSAPSRRRCRPATTRLLLALLHTLSPLLRLLALQASKTTIAKGNCNTISMTLN